MRTPLCHSLRLCIGRALLALTALSLALLPLVAQNTTPQQSYLLGRKLLLTQIEAMQADELLQDEQAEEWIALYEQLSRNPLDLNSATLEELMALPLMREYLAYQLIKYRAEQGGALRELSDLKMVEGWSEADLALYRPLLYLGTMGAEPRGALLLPSKLLKGGKSRADLLLVRPFTEDKERTAQYLGSPLSAQLRWHWSSPHASAMLSAERDSYEPWRRESHRGFDSYAGHVALRDLSVLRQLVLGDYRVSWGEGLVIHQGFGRGTLSRGYNTHPMGIRPQTTTAESDKSRGIATELQLGKRWRLSALYSRRYLDGRLDPERQLISALSETGLHRTAQDWARRGAVTSRHYGAQLRYQLPRLSLALSLLSYDWGGWGLRTAPGASSSPELRGVLRHDNYSLSYLWSSRRGTLSLSGELARGSLGGWAQLQRLSYQNPLYGAWHIALRHIGKRYWSYYGQGATHYLRPYAEQGVGIGWRLPPLLPRVELSIESDHYRSLAPRRAGFERGALYRAEMLYRPHASALLSLRLRYSTRSGQGSSQRATLRYTLISGRWSWTPSLSLGRSRSENTRLTTPTAYSLGLRADCQLTEGLRFSASAALYRVEDWRDRLYWSEPRLSRQFSSTFLYGRGYRLTLASHARLSRSLMLSLQLMHHSRRAPHPRQSQLALQLSSRW